MVRKKRDKELLEIIGVKTQRKKNAHRKRQHIFRYGFSVFGVIGWSVALPSLLGAALGLWLDENYPRQQPWVLAMILAGLSLGCFNAWRILEHHRIQISRNGDDEHEQ